MLSEYFDRVSDYQRQHPRTLIYGCYDPEGGGEEPWVQVVEKMDPPGGQLLYRAQGRGPEHALMRVAHWCAAQMQAGR